MEKLNALKKVVFILAALLVFEMGVIVIAIRPNSLQLWLSLAVLMIICIYLVSLCLGLIKELKNKLKQ